MPPVGPPSGSLDSSAMWTTASKPRRSATVSRRTSWSIVETVRSATRERQAAMQAPVAGAAAARRPAGGLVEVVGGAVGAAVEPAVLVEAGVDADHLVAVVEQVRAEQ